MSRASLQTVLDSLAAEGLLTDAAGDRSAALIARLQSVQPWYIRAMVGVGAWLASLMLISFVAGFGLAFGNTTIVGIGLVVGALLFRRQSDNDFVVQSTLAASLAGQALFAYGLSELLPGNDEKLLFGIVLGVSVALFVLFPDRIHRGLSVIIGVASLTLLIYTFEMNALIPLLGPLAAAVLVLVYRQRDLITAKGYGHLVRPLEIGLMISAFGCLLLSTIYLLPELETDFVFYPRPWISTILLGALFLYAGNDTWRSLADGSRKGGMALVYVYGLVLAIIAAAWAAPGLLLALLVLMLGASTGNRSFVGAGIVFLAVFVGAYFYGIETTLLLKSLTLMGSGAVILLARWMLLNVLAGEEAAGG